MFFSFKKSELFFQFELKIEVKVILYLQIDNTTCQLYAKV
ncbi:hypothetical protein J500_1920 [Acinetobacter sp. 479375]|nr:hypothetical protein J500_1920 [Acinetobacter sp. 479375]